MNPHPREKTLFAQALELATPAEREAFLRQACGDDAALHRRLLALLAAHEVTTAFLPGEARRTVAAPLAEFPAEQPGAVIGRYKLLEKVGEGGCGVVYVAEQTEPVRRRVALKVIKLGMDTKSVVARFEAERQALALMDHPNIAKVLDAGATELGRPYFVMELVRGIPITHYCDQNNLSTQARLDLFIQVCQAVQHAHQKGIIHRDLKPSNILVTVNDGQPVPKVIDFGIAKATEGRLTDATIYTQLHQFIGTPAYMSPEQAEMTSLDIDTRSDIYSLGVLLYELLAGRTPFEARELMAAGLDTMRWTIREKEPSRPSTRLATLQGEELSTTARRRATEPPKLLRQLRGDLDWIVMKCLEKDRTRRYETANGLAADLQRHLSHEPVLARPPSAAYRLQKAWQRYRPAFALAALIAVVLVVATAFSMWQARLARRAQTEATARAQAEMVAREEAEASEARALAAEHEANLRAAAEMAAREEAEASEARAVAAEHEANLRAAAEMAAREEANEVSQFLIQLFQSPEPAHSGPSVTVVEMLDQALQRLDREMELRPNRWISLLATFGETYDALGLHREALAIKERVFQAREELDGPDHEDTLGARQNLATTYHRLGRLEEAIRLQEEILAAFRQAMPPEDHRVLGAMHHLAISLRNAGHTEASLGLLQEAVETSRRHLDPESNDVLWALAHLAIGLESAGRLAESLALREKILPAMEHVNGPDHPNTLVLMIQAARLHGRTGRMDEALALSDELVRRSRGLGGSARSQALEAMGLRAFLLAESGRLEEAVAMREEMLPLARQFKGPEDPLTLAVLFDLAGLHARAGREAEAVRLLSEVLEAGRRRLPETHPLLRNARAQLASLHEAQDQAGEVPAPGNESERPRPPSGDFR